AVHARGARLGPRGAAGGADAQGIALTGAAGLWSAARARVGDAGTPQFACRTAWRALLPAKVLVPEFRENVVSLFLGPDTHLVLYPVKAGEAINVVAIVHDDWHRPGWSTAGRPEGLLAHHA